MCWREEGEKRDSGGLGKRHNSGAVDSEHGARPTRAEVRSCAQRATIPSKRVVNILKYLQNAVHAIIDNVCLV